MTGRTRPRPAGAKDAGRRGSASLRRKLRRADREVRILREVVAAVARSQDPAEALHRAATLVATQADAAVCDIFWYEHARRRLCWCASTTPRQPAGDQYVKPGPRFLQWYGKTARPYAIRGSAAEHPLAGRFPAAQDRRLAAVVLVPVMLGDRTVGLIVAGTASAAQLEPLRAVGEIVASAIAPVVDNARLRRDAQRRQEEWAALTAVGAAIAAGEPPQQVAMHIARTAVQVVGGVAGTVVFADRERTALQTVPAAVVLPDGTQTDGPVPAPVVDACARAYGTGTLVTEVRPSAAGSADPAAFAALPLRSGETLFGVVGVWSEEERRFGAGEIAALRSLADRAAAALDNARLQQAVVEAREELQARKQVERAKGILMRTFNLSEEEAYKQIHRKSMNTRKTMREIAEAIILAYETAP